MLDEYKKSQPIVYRILKNAIIEDKCSHAYLIETGDFYDSFNFVMSFVKSLLCPKKNLNKNNCGNCHQCEVIESGNFPEIEVITPDGLWIKKEQLQNLQKEFNTKALIGNKRVYIIKQAERLNRSAANSILKFLEEPDNNIVAILITDNVYSVLSTIRSRCQILRLRNTNIMDENKTWLDKIEQTVLFNKNSIIETNDLETLNLKINKIIEFVNYYEKNHLNTLLYVGKLWNEYITNKEELEMAYSIMINYYKDILNYLLKKPLEIFEVNNDIKIISKNNTQEKICQKLNKLVELKELIKYNINTNLLMDKLILSLEGVIS